MGTSEHSEHIQARFYCVDCGGPKSTEKTTRCWDCALKVKKDGWRKSAVDRSEKILQRRRDGLTMVEIAKEFGVSRQRVYQLVSAAGLKINGRPKK